MALALNERARQAHYYSGLVYLKLEKFDEATREFEAELALNPNDLEARYPIDIGAVQLRHPVVVVHDQCANHNFTSALTGIRTVKSAPRSLTTLTVPPVRRTIWLTRARPKPRRLRPAPFLVLKPS